MFAQRGINSITKGLTARYKKQNSNYYYFEKTDTAIYSLGLKIPVSLVRIQPLNWVAQTVEHDL